MNALLWLIVAIIVVLACCVAFIGWLARDAAQHDQCRTASASAMAADLAAIRAQVPSAARPKVRAGPRATASKVTPIRPAARSNLHQVQHEAVRAAFNDLSTGKTTPCPDPADSEAGRLWASEYARIVSYSAALDAKSEMA